MRRRLANSSIVFAAALAALLGGQALESAHAADAAALRLTDASLSDLDAALRSGAISSVELTVLYLNRIMTYDRRGPKLNAVPVLNPDALHEAARADALRSLGVELGPLQGITFVVKDSYNVAGLPTSVGVAAWKELRPTEDAFVVSKMRQAGAVLLGKANLDTFASNSDGVSEAFGAVKNPYGAKAVGGSSAGSAVAVAAHLSAVSFGGDTAGSLRMPASRNSVVSLRPTFGLISTAGTAPGDPLFDVVGPMTRTVRDLAVVLDVIASSDPHNPLNAYLPDPDKRRPHSYALAAPSRSLHGITLAVPRRLTGTKSDGARILTPGKPVLEAFAAARRRLEQAGARVIDVDVPVDAALDDTWYYDRDVSQAGGVAKPIYDARVALVNIRVFASEFARFCRGWCGDPASRMLDVAALFDYPEFMETFQVLREGTALDIESEPVAASIRTAQAIADGPLFAGWMKERNIDALLFPASSDGDSDTRFGLNYLSELGAPGLFVPAGHVSGGPRGTLQPLGVALVGKRFSERELLELGALVEAQLHARSNPVSTPALEDETMALDTAAIPPSKREDKEPPRLTIDHIQISDQGGSVQISGTAVDRSGISAVRLYVNGAKAQTSLAGAHWSARLPEMQPDDFLCVTDGLVIALAKDAAGNASATSRAMASQPDCVNPSHQNRSHP